jgi:hypothetical protein
MESDEFSKDCPAIILVCANSPTRNESSVTTPHA